MSQLHELQRLVRKLSICQDEMHETVKRIDRDLKRLLSSALSEAETSAYRADAERDQITPDRAAKSRTGVRKPAVDETPILKPKG